MRIRALFVLLAVCSVMPAAAWSRAGDPPEPDLKPLAEEVRKVVTKHYPKAEVSLKDGMILFAFNTRKYMIHETLLTGEWQDAHEEIGPQKGGVCGTLELRAGQYGGQAVVPQSFDKRYFTTLVAAPYSKKLDHHLYVHLKYARDVPKGFLKDFDLLVGEFEKHVSAGK